ncbi:MAG: amino acid permease, partial [Gammaproteobacteria bacterium]
LWLPPDSNIVSMAQKTAGRFAEVLAWVVYLLLLYSLISAYISGGSDVVHGLLQPFLPKAFSQRMAAIIFLLVFGTVVYYGIKPIDYMNRFLMTVKLTAFAMIILLILPNVNVPNLQGAHLRALVPAVTVVITSFGFANIIPSLRSYFHDDIKKLRIVIIAGSIIPLICYLSWVAVILAQVPLTGLHGLLQMLTSSEPTSELVRSLDIYLHSNSINTAAKIFTSISVATSFLGVALSLSDFLADGLKIKKKAKGKLYINALTFIPPLLIVLFYPAAFIAALNYAGFFCIILLVMMPIYMAWRGRYILNLPDRKYQVAGGKPALLLAFIAAILIIIQDILVVSKVL